MRLTTDLGRAQVWGVATLLVVTLTACSTAPSAPEAASRATRNASVANPSVEAAFVVRTAGVGSTVRVVTQQPQCPDIRFDAMAPERMAVRAKPAIVPLRHSKQAHSKAAEFAVLSCETPAPSGARTAAVAGQMLALPAAEVRRIVIIGDTGCTLKASDDVFQHCNDGVAWPFAAVAQQAAAMRPDLVVHLGDMHYRESPCPQAAAGCAGSPWGYGFDVWSADFFVPAKPLLAVAPWVFVRGNHESCARAGQGWYRFMDVLPWTSEMSCDDPRNDPVADFSAPYAVKIAHDTQLIVFDSSFSGGSAYKPTDSAFIQYVQAMRQVGLLQGAVRNNWFMNHHPVLGFSPTSKGMARPGSASLQSVLASVEPQRYFSAGINLAFHGHVHLFEAISFASQHPSTLVIGNSGSVAGYALNGTLPAGVQPAPGAVVKQFSTHAGFGFSVLDRVDAPGAEAGWNLTAFDVAGRALLNCAVRGAAMICGQLVTAP